MTTPVVAAPEVIVGLWRDGSQLVVDRFQHRFPPRCVMTNEPIVLLAAPLTLDYLPNRMAWSLLGKSIGRAIGRALYGEKVLLHAGISPAWQQRHAILRVVGTLAVWMGCFLGIPAILFELAARHASGAHAAQAIALDIIFKVAFIGLLLGGIVTLIISAPLRVSTINGNFVWLRGANASFLASLPQWPHPASAGC